jgi:hypothetical protein
MEYSQLKEILNVQAFDLICNMINNPTCELCLPNFNNIINPFDSTVFDMTSIIQDDYIIIKEVKCVYTNNKILVNEDDVNLGANYSLVIFVKYDEIPSQILNNISSTVIKFDNVFYNVKKPMNLYNILYEFVL